MTGTPTERALKRIETGHRLERLTVDLLQREGYEVDPTGTRGPDGGRDSILRRDGKTGILHCSINRQWETKCWDDAESSEERPESLGFYIFATTMNPAGIKRDRVEEEIREEYDWRVKIYDFERLRNRLVGNNRNHDLAKEHLSTDPGRAHVDTSEYVLDNLRQQYEQIQDENDIHQIGPLVENLIEDLFEKTVPDVGVRKSQYFGSTEAYEFILTNNSSRYPWRGMGPFVFADCKWLSNPISAQDVRNMSSKADMLHPECSGTVIFSRKGLSESGEQLVRELFAQGKYVIVFDENHLEEMLEDGYTDQRLESVADSLWL
ncbi:restriction endonuclease [Halogeometricum borinquense]|uniref:Restriction endonuclease n=1 Tax=Halogeometricum borinquense TaxID=60847 RepID=A0A6C0UN67_9EURY|nr:restriction endonuclease [Halogeometricum borinquense]QIB75339.1 restriction endonuclease [Halogeometricum borinquense]